MSELTPVNIRGKCVLPDDVLFRNMEAAAARGYPEVGAMLPEREGRIALVGSGPSAATQLATIKEMKAAGIPIVAIKDAHDWLIERGIIPDYGFAIDPQPHRFSCFLRKSPDVHYVIASQCDPAMFDYLDGHQVTIWHPYIAAGQKRPKGKALISGGTTSGLRGIVVFYCLGWRDFALFGYDSCLTGDVLRVNDTGIRPNDSVIEIQIEPNGEVFYCNPAMAQQAQHFQDHYDFLPGIQFEAFGYGLIPAIIKKRQQQIDELNQIRACGADADNRVSFIHWADDTAASYRYRARIPAEAMGASLNDKTAGTLIFSKPQANELMDMERARARGAWVVVDFCDDHFDWPHYAEALRLADMVTCPTEKMHEIIKTRGRTAMVIPDPYEYDELPPHCNGTRLLWFGHEVNKMSLARIMPDLEGYTLRVVSNFGGAIPWSRETLLEETAHADIVVLPATDEYKSPNRCIEAIRRGCFVVAEPHPALNNIPGIWIGNIKEGIEWAQQHPQQANERVSLSQSYVRERFHPKTLASAWKSAIQRPITSVAAKSIGKAG